MSMAEERRASRTAPGRLERVVRGRERRRRLPMSQGCSDGRWRYVDARRKMLMRSRGFSRTGGAAGVWTVCRRDSRKVRRRPSAREASVRIESSAGGIRSAGYGGGGGGDGVGRGGFSDMVVAVVLFDAVVEDRRRRPSLPLDGFASGFSGSGSSSGSRSGSPGGSPAPDSRPSSLVMIS